MGGMTGEDRAGIDAVARHHSAQWKPWRRTSPGAYLTIGGRRIAATVVAIAAGRGMPGGVPRLRFDRVVVELAGRLQADLRKLVPRRQALLIAITAPILQPGATATAIAEGVRHRLGRRPARLEIRQTVCGNAVRVSLMDRVAQRVPRTILFVHNPDPRIDVPGVLFGLARSLADHSGAAPGCGRIGAGGYDRWLVLVALQSPRSLCPALRHILSQLRIGDGFDRVLLVLSGGRVEPLEAGPRARRAARAGAPRQPRPPSDASHG